MKPDHVHGDAFSATMLLKPTVRRLNAANAFVTGHDKGAISPTLNPRAWFGENKTHSINVLNSIESSFKIDWFAFMVTRNRKNRLLSWEVRLVKAMLEEGGFGNNQDILAYFSRPKRSINHRAISEIRDGQKHARIKRADTETLKQYLKDWPHIDAATGLHLFDNELLIKSREAMLVAVQTYNNPKTYFRSEVFIVNAVIAWTYLLHAHFKNTGVDYRYKRIIDGNEQVVTTRHGAEKHWQLEECLGAPECTISDGAKNNLKFLIGIRHEIEHQMTKRIDLSLSAKLQACALNFNSEIKSLFGEKYSLESELSFAIQFAGINLKQKNILMGNGDLPPNIEAMRETFERGLSEDEYNDPQYAYRVIFVPKLATTKTQADSVMEFIPADSEEGAAINATYLREIDKPKYRPTKVVQLMNREGFENFKLQNHTNLWQSLDAKNPNKGYGIMTESDGWRWYEKWVDAVRQHCEEHRLQYT